jgi:hypothetical protein
MKNIRNALALVALAIAAEACAPEVAEPSSGGDGGAMPTSHHFTPAGSGRPCGGNPWWCAPDETCWPQGDGATWRCLVADPDAKKGDACVAGPIPSCNVGEFCGGLPLSSDSRCLAFCDDDGDCDAGERCVKIDGHIDAAHVCLGPDSLD